MREIVVHRQVEESGGLGDGRQQREDSAAGLEAAVRGPRRLPTAPRVRPALRLRVPEQRVHLRNPVIDGQQSRQSCA
jgi:hypothetical protein